MGLGRHSSRTCQGWQAHGKGRGALAAYLRAALAAGDTGLLVALVGWRPAALPAQVNTGYLATLLRGYPLAAR